MIATTEGPDKAVTPARVLVVSGTLLFLALPLLMLLQPATAPLAGEELLQERFEFSGLPWNFPLTEAVRLVGGEELVVLADPNYAPSEPDAREDGRGDGERGEDRGGERRGGRDRGRRGRGGGRSSGGRDSGAGWEKVEPTVAAGTPPGELTFVWYPLSAAEQLLERQFIRVYFSDTRSVDWNGGSVVVESGELDWHGYAPRYVVERHFKRVDGKQTFHDVVRVNLTIERQCCVAYLRWADGAAADKQVIAAGLERFGPKLSS